MNIDLYLKGFSEPQYDRMRRIATLLSYTINSDKFKTEILNFKFRLGNITYSHFYQCGLSNQDVYDKFMTGVDRYNKGFDNDMDIYVTLYHSRWSNTIGYTYFGSMRTWLNNKFFTLWKDKDEKIVNNLVHEYCHHIEGIDYHTRKYTDLRPYSVPYGLGKCAEIVAMYFKQYVKELKDSELLEIKKR
jgi:hypothetical protein